MRLHDLKPNPGARTRRTRVGRGIGSGLGKTSGRGQKGQKARSGGGVRPGFEGGQMPLVRRLPKRGFTSRSGADTAEVRLSDLERLQVEEIDLAVLKQLGVVPGRATAAKLIKSGVLTRKVSLRGIGVTSGAREAVTAAGGSIAE